MRSFTCDSCGADVYFRNSRCLACDTALGFRPSTRDVEVVTDDDVRCAQFELIGCSWLVEDGGGRCRSCRTTRTTPPQGDDELLAAWADTEAAKRRVLFQLLDLSLPLDVAEYDLVASRLDDTVMIGHADGLVTIDVDETDDARRERMRDRLDEPYRTVLGHIRHELGHALFPILVTDQPDSGLADRVRDVFGDWTEDYQDALDRHYADGAPDGWEEEHVSAYATMHPAEDWAESFAHVLHLRDVSQTAASFGLRVDGHAVESTVFDDLVAGWIPLTRALNAVTRAMGDDDLYPFVLSAPVIDKLRLVDEVIAAHAA